MSNPMNIPRVVIAATHSGAGKTSVTLGLLRALRRRGLTVQPFKVGPDFIDPTLHDAALGQNTLRQKSEQAGNAAGRISRNLDSWLLPHNTVVELFARAAEGADVAVIEGVMGLYDGVHGKSEEASTAEIAKWLRAPVALVVDGAGAVRSAAAMALGFSAFDPEIAIAGVIINRVGGARHEAWLRDAMTAAGLPVLGVLPWEERIRLPERHLGLVPASEWDYEETLDALADAVEAHVDVEAILRAARLASRIVVPGPQAFPPMPVPPVVSIGVARDEAFSFYYQDSLDLLESRGARLIFFSPLHDPELPPVHGLYLGGGFPEAHAAALSGNATMRQQVSEAARDGLPVYAECGGMMYLAQQLVDAEGHAHKMVGLLPAITQMHPRFVALSYVTLEAGEDTLLLRRGEQVRGHEFHFSTVRPTGEIKFAFTSTEGRGIEDGKDGIYGGTLLASYTHLHFASFPAMAERFVEACKNYKNGTRNTEVKR